MNNLSWFIYLTQVVDSLGTVLAILFWVTFAGMSLWLLMGGVTSIDEPHPSEVFNSWRRTLRYVVPAMIAVAIATIVLPSRKTMILIAGSEIGERAVNSQAAHDIINPGMDLLKSWIANEAAKLKKEKS